MMRTAFLLGVVFAAPCAGAAADEFYVPSDGSIVTSGLLAAGRTYIIEAEGFYQYRGDDPDKIADAEWVRTYVDDAWTWVETPGGGDLDLYVDGADISMMGSEDGVTFRPHVFSPDNTYRATVFGQGAAIALSIYDTQYDDNIGGLNVTISLLAAGDTNADGAVDVEDYENLIAQFGAAPGEQSADFNGDGIVDLTDFALLRANFGQTVGPAPGGQLGAAAPEPATLTAMLLGALAVIGPRRSSRRYAK